MAIAELKLFRAECDGCGDHVDLAVPDMDRFIVQLAALGWTAQNRSLLCAKCLLGVSGRC